MGRQEIDIFIPELSIGIEYQGQQHYHPIKYWGGKNALVENEKRDERKRELCKKNKVGLCIFTYKEQKLLSKEYVLNKIQKVLGKNKDT